MVLLSAYSAVSAYSAGIQQPNVTSTATHQQHQYSYHPPPGHYYQPPVYVSNGYTTTYSPITPQQQCPNGTGSSAPGAADLMI